MMRRAAWEVARRIPFGQVRTYVEVAEMAGGSRHHHARKLQDAGYVTMTKTFAGRAPKTIFLSPTAAGRPWMSTGRCSTGYARSTGGHRARSGL